MNSKEFAFVLIAVATLSVFSTVAQAARGSTRAKSAPLVKAITASDLRSAARAAGLTMRGDTILNECDEPFEELKKEDLNKDGQPEIILVDGICSGMAGSFIILTKGADGAWRQVLSFQGGHEFTQDRHGGWPDVETGGPGISRDYPKFRWNGSAYVQN